MLLLRHDAHPIDHEPGRAQAALRGLHCVCCVRPEYPSRAARLSDRYARQFQMFGLIFSTLYVTESTCTSLGERLSQGAAISHGQTPHPLQTTC